MCLLKVQHQSAMTTLNVKQVCNHFKSFFAVKSRCTLNGLFRRSVVILETGPEPQQSSEKCFRTLCGRKRALRKKNRVKAGSQINLKLFVCVVTAEIDCR